MSITALPGVRTPQCIFVCLCWILQPLLSEGSTQANSGTVVVLHSSDPSIVSGKFLLVFHELHHRVTDKVLAEGPLPITEAFPVISIPVSCNLDATSSIQLVVEINVEESEGGTPRSTLMPSPVVVFLLFDTPPRFQSDVYLAPSWGIPPSIATGGLGEVPSGSEIALQLLDDLTPQAALRLRVRVLEQTEGFELPQTEFRFYSDRGWHLFCPRKAGDPVGSA